MQLHNPVVREAEDAVEVVHDEVPVLLCLNVVHYFNSKFYHDLVPDLHLVVEVHCLVVFWNVSVNQSPLDDVRITGWDKRLL